MGDGNLSAIAMHISSVDADASDDLSAAVVFPPYRLDGVPVCANLVASTNEAAMPRIFSSSLEL